MSKNDGILEAVGMPSSEEINISGREPFEPFNAYDDLITQIPPKKKIKVKAVLLTDGEHYFIHGSDEETFQDSFAKMAPIWSFDPASEVVHTVEFEVTVTDPLYLKHAKVT